MINLTETEKMIIKLCKGHLQKEYPFTGSWVNTLKPLFIKYYGWNPDEDNNYRDYLECIFYKLLEIHLKIVDDESGSNLQLRNIFSATLYKGISNDAELPIERGIHALCGLLQNNRVIKNDIMRYDLQ